MSAVPGEIAANLACVRVGMERAAARSGRSAAEITLVAVSKTQPAAKVRELHEAGVFHFGENRVQEREVKSFELSDLPITWHMIGHLQKNKVARAAMLFHAIDSVDNIPLAEKLDRAVSDGFKGEKRDNPEKIGRSELATHEPATRMSALIEVKLDPEPAKSGVEAAELPRLVEAVLHMPRLELRGLMGVPPYFDDPERARPYFGRLRELRDSLGARFPTARLPVLSMGMSHDFEVAIEEGATEIRVGTALFGERVKV
jgi:PLP dependent protein